MAGSMILFEQHGREIHINGDRFRYTDGTEDKTYRTFPYHRFGFCDHLLRRVWPSWLFRSPPWGSARWADPQWEHYSEQRFRDEAIARSFFLRSGLIKISLAYTSGRWHSMGVWGNDFDLYNSIFSIRKQKHMDDMVQQIKQSLETIT